MFTINRKFLLSQFTLSQDNTILQLNTIEPGISESFENHNKFTIVSCSNG